MFQRVLDAFQLANELANTFSTLTKIKTGKVKSIKKKKNYLLKKGFIAPDIPDSRVSVI